MSGASTFAALTSLRGVLALWVVLYHFRVVAETLVPGLQVFSPLLMLGHLAVPAFFMLSGFVLSLSYGDHFSVPTGHRDIVRFWLLRLARIYPVHLVTLLAFAVMIGGLHLVGMFEGLAGFSTNEFVRNLLLVHMWRPVARLSWNYPSWSISSEWFAYLCFPVAALLLGRIKARVAPVVLGGLFVGTVATGVVYYARGHTQPFFGIFCVLPLFAAGMMLFELHRLAAPCAPTRVRRWLCVLFAAIPAAAYLPVPDADQILVMFLLAALIVGLVAAAGSAPRFLRSGPMLVLGEASYSLYMTHALAHIFLIQTLPVDRYVDSGLLARLGIGLVYSGLVVILCIVCFRWVEQPSRRWLKSRINRYAQVGPPSDATPGGAAREAELARS